MLGDRKQTASTTVFAFDDKGKKRVRLSPREFGARNEERLGSNVQGLALPPPTQFIVVPRELLDADQVLLDIVQEKRTFSWQVNRAKTAAAETLKRAEQALSAWWWRARVEFGKLTLELRERMRTPEADDNWSCDVTEIVERPPPLRRRARSSV